MGIDSTLPEKIVSNNPRGEERVPEAYGPKKYQRLVTLKDKYDPGNMFRSNMNIKPSVNT